MQSSPWPRTPGYYWARRGDRTYIGWLVIREGTPSYTGVNSVEGAVYLTPALARDVEFVGPLVQPPPPYDSSALACAWPDAPGWYWCNLRPGGPPYEIAHAMRASFDPPSAPLRVVTSLGRLRRGDDDAAMRQFWGPLPVPEDLQ